MPDKRKGRLDAAPAVISFGVREVGRAQHGMRFPTPGFVAQIMPTAR